MKILFCVLVLALALSAQTLVKKHESVEQFPAAPEAQAQLCLNQVIPESAKESAFLDMQSQGCQDVHFEYLSDGYWLAYGIKVIR
jgi:hypothetical protein